MIDPVGDRFKEIERRWRGDPIPPGFMVVRVDGRAFHTFTRGLPRPFDLNLQAAMDQTALALVQDLPGVICAYVQSDEISLVSWAPGDSKRELWYGGQRQKVASVSASVATAAFNRAFTHPGHDDPALFDARVFALDGWEWLGLYLKWRQDDAKRNAISMLVSNFVPHGELEGVPTLVRKKLLESWVNLGDVDPGFLHGRLVARGAPEPATGTYMHKVTNETVEYSTTRTPWKVEPVADLATWVSEYGASLS